MLSIAPPSSQPETIVLEPVDEDVADAICRPLRDVVAPSTYRKTLWAVQAGLDRKFGSALESARRFVEQSVELACIQRELTRHITDCPMCCQPELVCLSATEMQIRESALLTGLAGGL